jgi:hypothetical protein
MRKSIMLIAVAILFFVGLNSCQNDGTTSPLMQGTTTSQVGAYSSDFISTVYTTEGSTLIEGSITQEIASCPPPPPHDSLGPPPPPDTNRMGMGPRDTTRMGPGQPGKMNPRDRFDPLGAILFRLKLTVAQTTKLRTYMKDHMDCIKAAEQALRDSEKPIMDNARTQQKAIMDQVKAGTMTRADAKIALKTLNDATRKALNDNPARQAACIAMEACKKALNDQILALLTDAQKVLFQAWLDKQPVVDCTPKTKTTP